MKTKQGYGTYEWMESERRLEALDGLWIYAMGPFDFGPRPFDYSITYDFEGGTK